MTKKVEHSPAKLSTRSEAKEQQKRASRKGTDTPKAPDVFTSLGKLGRDVFDAVTYTPKKFIMTGVWIAGAAVHPVKTALGVEKKVELTERFNALTLTSHNFLTGKTSPLISDAKRSEILWKISTCSPKNFAEVERLVAHYESIEQFEAYRERLAMKLQLASELFAHAPELITSHADQPKGYYHRALQQLTTTDDYQKWQTGHPQEAKRFEEVAALFSEDPLLAKGVKVEGVLTRFAGGAHLASMESFEASKKGSTAFDKAMAEAATLTGIAEIAEVLTSAELKELPPEKRHAIVAHMRAQNTLSHGPAELDPIFGTLLITASEKLTHDAAMGILRRLSNDHANAYARHSDKAEQEGLAPKGSLSAPEFHAHPTIKGLVNGKDLQRTIGVSFENQSRESLIQVAEENIKMFAAMEEESTHMNEPSAPLVQAQAEWRGVLKLAKEGKTAEARAKASYLREVWHLKDKIERTKMRNYKLAPKYVILDAMDHMAESCAKIAISAAVGNVVGALARAAVTLVGASEGVAVGAGAWANAAGFSVSSRKLDHQAMWDSKLGVGWNVAKWGFEITSTRALFKMLEVAGKGVNAVYFGEGASAEEIAMAVKAMKPADRIAYQASQFLAEMVGLSSHTGMAGSVQLNAEAGRVDFNPKAILAAVESFPEESIKLIGIKLGLMGTHPATELINTGVSKVVAKKFIAKDATLTAQTAKIMDRFVSAKTPREHLALTQELLKVSEQRARLYENMASQGIIPKASDESARAFVENTKKVLAQAVKAQDAADIPRASIAGSPLMLAMALPAWMEGARTFLKLATPKIGRGFVNAGKWIVDGALRLFEPWPGRTTARRVLVNVGVSPKGAAKFLDEVIKKRSKIAPLVLEALPKAFDVLTTKGLTPEAVTELLGRVVEKTGEKAPIVFKSLPRAFDALTARGFSIEAATELLGRVLEKTGWYAPQAFEALPTLLAKGLSPEVSVEFLGNVIEKTGWRSPEAFETLPTLLDKGYSPGAATDLLGTVIDRTGWSAPEVFKDLSKTFDALTTRVFSIEAATEFLKKIAYNATWLTSAAAKALDALVAKGLSPETAIELLGNVVKEARVSAFPLLKDLSKSFDALTTRVFSIEAAAEFLGKIAKKNLRFAPAAAKALDALFAKGHSLEAAIEFLGKVIEKTGHSAPAVFGALPALLDKGHSPEAAFELLGKVMWKTGHSAPSAFGALPALLDKGHSPEAAIELLGNVIEKTGEYTSGAFEAMSALLDKGHSPEAAIELLGKVTEKTGKNDRGAFEALTALLAEGLSPEAAVILICKIAEKTGGGGYSTFRDVPSIFDSLTANGLSPKAATELIGRVAEKSGTHASQGFSTLKHIHTSSHGDYLRLLEQLNDYNRERVLSELAEISQPWSTMMTEKVHASYFRLITTVFERHPRLGFNILEGLKRGVETRVLSITEAPDAKDIFHFIDRTHGFNPVLYREYQKHGDAVFAELDAHAQRITHEEMGVDEMRAIEKQHGMDFLLAIIQRTSPTSGASFVKKSEQIGLLEKMIEAGDLRGHIPTAWKNRVESFEFAMGGHRVKTGQHLDPNGKVVVLLDRFRVKETAEGKEKPRIEDVTSAFRRYLGASDPKSKAAAMEDVRTALYRFAGEQDALREKIDRIQDLDYSTLHLLRQLFGDKDNLQQILVEALTPISDAELADRGRTALPPKVGPFTKSLRQVWDSEGRSADEKRLIIASILKSYSDVEQRLLRDPRVADQLGPELTNEISEIQAHMPTYLRKLILDSTVSNPLALINEEIGKFEYNGSGTVKVGIRAVKGPAFGLHGLTSGVCIATDMVLWKNPNFKLLAITDEGHNQVVGYVHAFEVVQDGKKYLTLPGINPSAEFLGTVSAKEFYPRMMEKIAAFAEAGGYDAVLIPTEKNIHSNRGDISTEIKRAKYSTRTLSKAVEWNTVPMPYRFNEAYVAWEHGKLGLHSKAIPEPTAGGGGLGAPLMLAAHLPAIIDGAMHLISGGGSVARSVRGAVKGWWQSVAAVFGKPAPVATSKPRVLPEAPLNTAEPPPIPPDPDTLRHVEEEVERVSRFSVKRAVDDFHQLDSRLVDADRVIRDHQAGKKLGLQDVMLLGRWDLYDNLLRRAALAKALDAYPKIGAAKDRTLGALDAFWNREFKIADVLDMVVDEVGLRQLADARARDPHNGITTLNAFLRGELGREPRLVEVHQLLEVVNKLRHVGGFNVERMLRGPDVPTTFQIYTTEFLDAMATRIQRESAAFRATHGRDPVIVEIAAGDGRLSRGLKSRGIGITPTDVGDSDIYKTKLSSDVVRKDGVAAAQEADIIIGSWLPYDHESPDFFDAQILRHIMDHPEKRLILIGEGPGGMTESVAFDTTAGEGLNRGRLRTDYPTDLNRTASDEPLSTSFLAFVHGHETTGVTVYRGVDAKAEPSGGAGFGGPLMMAPKFIQGAQELYTRVVKGLSASGQKSPPSSATPEPTARPSVEALQRDLPSWAPDYLKKPITDERDAWNTWSQLLNDRNLRGREIVADAYGNYIGEVGHVKGKMIAFEKTKQYSDLAAALERASKNGPAKPATKDLGRLRKLTIDFGGEGGQFGIEFNGASEKIIGRGRFGIKDDYMSVRHAALIFEGPETLYIRDLESMNGTYVNGVKVPRGDKYRLYESDVVKIGQQTFVVHDPIERLPNRPAEPKPAPPTVAQERFSRAIADARTLPELKAAVASYANGQVEGLKKSDIVNMLNGTPHEIPTQLIPNTFGLRQKARDLVEQAINLDEAPSGSRRRPLPKNILDILKYRKLDKEEDALYAAASEISADVRENVYQVLERGQLLGMITQEKGKLRERVIQHMKSVIETAKNLMPDEMASQKNPFTGEHVDPANTETQYRLARALMNDRADRNVFGSPSRSEKQSLVELTGHYFPDYRVTDYTSAQRILRSNLENMTPEVLSMLGKATPAQKFIMLETFFGAFRHRYYADPVKATQLAMLLGKHGVYRELSLAMTEEGNAVLSLGHTGWTTADSKTKLILHTHPERYANAEGDMMFGYYGDDEMKTNTSRFDVAKPVRRSSSVMPSDTDFDYYLYHSQLAHSENKKTSTYDPATREYRNWVLHPLGASEVVVKLTSVGNIESVVVNFNLDGKFNADSGYLVRMQKIEAHIKGKMKGNPSFKGIKINEVVYDDVISTIPNTRPAAQAKPDAAIAQVDGQSYFVVQISAWDTQATVIPGHPQLEYRWRRGNLEVRSLVEGSVGTPRMIVDDGHLGIVLQKDKWCMVNYGNRLRIGGEVLTVSERAPEQPSISAPNPPRVVKPVAMPVAKPVIPRAAQAQPVNQPDKITGSPALQKDIQDNATPSLKQSLRMGVTPYILLKAFAATSHMRVPIGPDGRVYDDTADIVPEDCVYRERRTTQGYHRDVEALAGIVRRQFVRGEAVLDPISGKPITREEVETVIADNRMTSDAHEVAKRRHVFSEGAREALAATTHRNPRDLFMALIAENAGNAAYMTPKMLRVLGELRDYVVQEELAWGEPLRNPDTGKDIFLEDLTEFIDQKLGSGYSRALANAYDIQTRISKNAKMDLWGSLDALVKDAQKNTTSEYKVRLSVLRDEVVKQLHENKKLRSPNGDVLRSVDDFDRLVDDRLEASKIEVPPKPEPVPVKPKIPEPLPVVSDDMKRHLKPFVDSILAHHADPALEDQLSDLGTMEGVPGPSGYKLYNNPAAEMTLAANPGVANARWQKAFVDGVQKLLPKGVSSHMPVAPDGKYFVPAMSGWYWGGDFGREHNPNGASPWQGRIFFSVDSDHDLKHDIPKAAVLYATLTKMAHDLQKKGVSIEFKVTAKRSDRSDAAVLYFEAKDEKIVHDWMVRISRLGLMRKNIPLFVAPLTNARGVVLPGIGFAQHPSNGGSFGMRRVDALGPMRRQLTEDAQSGINRSRSEIEGILARALMDAGVDPLIPAFEKGGAEKFPHMRAHMLFSPEGETPTQKILVSKK